MKVAERTIEAEGTLHGERVAMGIDPGAVAHIMGVLTDLYSDPETAIIREYSTNALDAHVVAGVRSPIEVSLPTPLRPELRIRDFGEGLDIADIRGIYSQYGTSTKRSSNEVVGMLGLGCKSALTYTDQFTLIGYKNGQATTVSVGRDERGAGTMTVVDVRPTHETGVDVRIPIRRENDIAGKAAQFFRYWEPGTVLVDGQEPEPLGGTPVSDAYRLCSSAEGVSGGVVVMGGVPYPVPPNTQISPVSWRLGGVPTNWLVARVPIGRVDVTPSREALQMTGRTRLALEEIAVEAKALVEEGLRQAIGKADTIEVALSHLSRADGVLNGRAWRANRPAVWKGVALNTLLDAPAGKDGEGVWIAASTQAGVRGRMRTGEAFLSLGVTRNTRYGHFPPPLSESVVVERFTGASFTDIRKMKLQQHLGGSALPSGVVGTSGALSVNDRKILKHLGVRVVQWEDVAAETLPKAAPGSRSGGGVFHVLRRSADYPRLEDASAGEIAEMDAREVVYFAGRKHAAYSQSTNCGLWLFPDHPVTRVIVVPSGRLDKFKRDFPNVPEMHERAREVAAEMRAAMSEDDIVAFNIQRAVSRHLGGYLGYITPDMLERILDPKVKRWKELARRSIDTKVMEVLRATTATPPGLPHTEEYPLLPSHDTRMSDAAADHVVLYINAVYTANLKEDA